MPNREEIMDKVRECMMEALGVDAEEVVPSATLIGDLGAESIDFLDIVFRLEKSFGIKIPRGDLFPENLVSNPELVQDGKLTAEGLAEIKSKMPFADTAELEKDPQVSKLGDLFTVEMIIRYIESKVAS